MEPSSKMAKFLRFIGILFMSLTAGFTVLGGAGTSCAAFAPTNWESMAKLAPFQWLYILYVVLTIAIGILGIRAVVFLIRGAKDSYKAALIALVSGVIVGGIHIATSRALRGSSMPVDAVVGMTVLTLVIFLLFRIPGVWKGVDYSKAPKKENRKAGGAAAMVVAGLCLTIQYWMGPTHTWSGVNYANAFNTSMTMLAFILLFLGAGLLCFDQINEYKSLQRATKQLDFLS
jgi:hypothetical protein